MESEPPGRERKIHEAILDHAMKGNRVTIERDLGEGSATVWIGENHFHTGFVGATTDELIEHLFFAFGLEDAV